MSESELYPAIIGALSRGETRLFRQQSMLAWAGKILSRTATTITLQHPHAVKIGAPGMADLGGLTAVLITPAMVGSILGVDVQIEVKARGNPTDEQANYIAMCRSLGGRAGIARTLAEAQRIISGA